jgi:hypothetical protein
MKILKNIVDTLKCKPSKTYKKQARELDRIETRVIIKQINLEAWKERHP